MRIDKLLEKFYYQPMSCFGVRQLARETKMDAKTVMKRLDSLVKRKIVVKIKEDGKFPHYEANRLAIEYTFEKSHYLTAKIIESGLIQMLDKKLNAKAIVLYGSVQKGIYHEKSDIDLFIYGKYSRIKLDKFEKKIGHNTHLLFEEDLRNLSTGLLGNIYNGRVLSGTIDVIE